MVSNFGRRIAYQEETQTFGVISMRTEYFGPDGLVAQRPSASTKAMSTTSSSRMPQPHMGGHGGENLRTGDEVELFSLLIYDQHTFEGIHIYTAVFH